MDRQHLNKGFVEKLSKTVLKREFLELGSDFTDSKIKG
jgi:hypothetical protein